MFLAVRFRALDKDALNSSHAVSTEVNKPEQVEEMFDSVSYEKVRLSNSTYLLYMKMDATILNSLDLHTSLLKGIFLHWTSRAFRTLVSALFRVCLCLPGCIHSTDAECLPARGPTVQKGYHSIPERVQWIKHGH